VEVWKAKARLVLAVDFCTKTGRTPDEAHEAAVAALARVEETAPGDPEIPALRALLHRRRGWDLYKTRVKFAKSDPARAAAAGRLAAEEFRRAYEAWPEDPENASVRGTLGEIAPDDLKWVDRRLADAAYQRGLEAWDRGDWDTAAKDFARAAELVPEWTEFHFRLGMALVRSGRAEEAVPSLERVANAGDGADYPEACSELAEYYLGRRGPMDRRIARAWLERFVKVMEGRGSGGDERTERARRLLKELVPE
jgi:tetratricopeptide (TPR) repeat protein